MSRASALMTVVAALAAGALFVASRSSGGSYTVHADFADAAGLRGHSQVKVGGVVVGMVDSMTVTPRNTALVTLKVKDTRISRDARAYIRPVNLLGEKYVDLEPGVERPALPSGSLIPLSRTGTPVELDQVLDTLDASTRTRLEILIDSSGQSLAGRGADFGATLASLPPALDQAQAMIGAFAQDNQALGRLVETSDRVIGAMAGQRKALGGLVTTGSSALGSVASRDSQLGQTLQQAAPAIGQLRSTLGSLQQSAIALAPAANGLRASAPNLAATLRALPGFAVAARPTLNEAQGVAPTLTRLGTEATPVVRRLRPVADRLSEFATAFGPLSATLDQGKADLLGFLEGWARAIQVGDNASHMFRNQLVISSEIVTQLLAHYLRPAAVRHSVARTPRAPLPAAPSHRQPGAPPPISLPSLTSQAQLGVPALTHQVQQTVQQLIQTITPPPDQSNSVSHLLGYLLGK